jgi:hypothetical protein
MTRTVQPDPLARSGFSDEELEARCQLDGMFDSKIVPWALWESEHTSYGRAFRALARYPGWLPLLFGADHGVMHGSRCWTNETDTPYPAFFTWLAKKNVLMRTKCRKRSYHIAHPWSFYRRKYFPRLPADRAGTLVYFPHSNATSSHVFDVEQYIADLQSLPAQYQPVTICLSFHDVWAGLHKRLRKYGIPLVTAGHGNSRRFIDRFYSLLYPFRYATSPNVGSHTFYIMEAGVPFFLFGPYPRIEVKNSPYVEDGVYGAEILGDEEDQRKIAAFIDLLYERTDEITATQRAYVTHYLGLDSPMTRRAVAVAVWREAFSIWNWGHYVKSVSGRLRQRMTPTVRGAAQ